MSVFLLLNVMQLVVLQVIYVENNKWRQMKILMNLKFLESYHQITILSKGAFGKMVLAGRMAPDESTQIYALRVLKKTHIVSYCNISHHC
jgi:hypothetical protein